MKKATKWIAIVAFTGLGLFAEGALAQGNDQTDTSTPPPAVTDESATPVEETQPYNETVTIDGGTDAPPAETSDAGIAAEPERKERLRVYSGKHDGNNVIVDPR